ncbi:MAG: hypothetical protein PF495_11970 [Spirochaetales bacterium]|jgi:lysozyme family protein|nr:hypothetical protein [Spirochaetales bacterium]
MTIKVLIVGTPEGRSSRVYEAFKALSNMQGVTREERAEIYPPSFYAKCARIYSFR